jgi:hypothetical protein
MKLNVIKVTGNNSVHGIKKKVKKLVVCCEFFGVTEAALKGTRLSYSTRCLHKYSL